MKWFGNNWGAPICTDVEHWDTPVGLICARGCGHSIRQGDQGLLLVTDKESLTLDGQLNYVEIRGAPYVGFHLVCIFDELGIRGVTHR